MKAIGSGTGKSRYTTMLAVIGLLTVLFCFCAEAEDTIKTPETKTVEDGRLVSEDTLELQTTKARAVTGLRFEYDKYSGEQYYLNAYVEDMTENGGKITLIKRVGPMNYTGHKKEGELTLSGEQVALLWEILDRYDLKAWSQLPTKSSSVSPTRNLIVFRGEKILYRVMWNARFPKTLPPQEDILYFELYNFFNDLVAAESGWEDVISENLKDPRDNPAYYE